MKMKKTLSAILSLTMAASAFSALWIPASAEDKDIATSLLHTATFKVMSRDAEDQAVYSYDNELEFANMTEKNDWIGTAVMQFSVDDAVDFSKVKSAALSFNVENTNTTKTSTLSVYATGKSDYDVTALAVTDLYTLPEAFGSGAGVGVTINAEGALGGMTSIANVPDLAASFNDIVSVDITDYVKNLPADTTKISLAVSNSNRGVNVTGKGATEKQPSLTIVQADEVLYNATVNTNAYAKVTYGENVYYSGADGKVEISGLTDSTVVDIAVEKGGYASINVSKTINGADAVIDAVLTPLDENTVYYEDFDNAPVIDSGAWGFSADAKLYTRIVADKPYLQVVTSNGGRTITKSFGDEIAVADNYTVDFDLKSYLSNTAKTGQTLSYAFTGDAGDIFKLTQTCNNAEPTGSMLITTGADAAGQTVDVLDNTQVHVNAAVSGEKVVVTITSEDTEIGKAELATAGGQIKGITLANNQQVNAEIDNFIIKKTDVKDEPTEAPTEPTEVPTEPTEVPTEPTDAPTEVPTEPTEAPTEVPTEPTEAPTEPTEAPTPAPTPAASTPVPAGTVLYEQNYDDTEDTGWVVTDVTPTFETNDSGKYVKLTHVAGKNSRGNYTNFGDLPAGKAYAIEFDLALTSNTDQTSNFAIKGSDFAYTSNNIHWGAGSGYILKMSAGNSTTWTINDDAANTVTVDAGKFYHYTVATKGNAAYLTIADGETKVLDNKLLTINGAGGLSGLYWLSGRSASILAIDNIVVRELNEGEVPDINYYTATINTTRFAAMKAGDETYYADVNGKIEIPLLTSGTTIDYTLSKVGYGEETGTIEITDADVTVDKPLTLTDESIIFIESEFGNASNAFVTAASSRGDSVALGTVELPSIVNVSVDLSVSKDEEQQYTWVLKNASGAIIVGLQGQTGKGLYAFTGWSGNSAYNQSSDAGAFTNSVLVADTCSGDKTVDFVIDNTNKNITVSYGDSSQALPLIEDASTMASMQTGKYRLYAEVKIDEIRVTKPDPMYMAITGDNQVAKIAGKTVTREYGKTETVITPDETFEWTIAGDDTTGLSITNDGVLTIADTAVPGTYAITATGSTGKTASLDVKVEDFANVTAAIDGPKAYTKGQTGQYVITSLVDEYGDDVIGMFDPQWTSSDTDVITIDAETGLATAVANGTATITLTIGNPGKPAAAQIPVTVDVYSIVVNATGNSTVVDITDILGKNGATSYLVTTAKDGAVVNQYTITDADLSDGTPAKNVYAEDGILYHVRRDENGIVTSVTTTAFKAGDEVIECTADHTNYAWTADMKPVQVVTTGGDLVSSVTVDTTGADKVEITPIYETTIGKLMEIPAARYNVTVTANNGRRTDVYANEQMMFNNINQGSDNWTVGRIIADSTDYTANDVYIGQGYVEFKLYDDQSGGTTITKVTFAEAPSIVERAKRIYLIGDSLVANYYGDAPEGQENLVRTGWGQVFDKYVADGVEVTNLGNSGAWATGMLSDAFTNVIGSAQPGDIVVWESGYNDRAHSTVEEMKAAITEAVNKCEEMGIDIYLVNPNASRHDYGSGIVYSQQMRDLAAEIDTPLIDLTAKSYEFLSGLYGTDAAAANDVLVTYYNNTGDTLHSSYNAANLWAAIVAQGLYDAGNTEYIKVGVGHTFNDGTQDISAEVKDEPVPAPAE